MWQQQAFDLSEIRDRAHAEAAAWSPITKSADKGAHEPDAAFCVTTAGEANTEPVVVLGLAASAVELLVALLTDLFNAVEDDNVDKAMVRDMMELARVSATVILALTLVAPAIPLLKFVDGELLP